MTLRPTLPLLLVATLGSGAASLTLEVLWSKALVVPLGNSTDATSLVLVGFMLGIALGAWVGGRIVQVPRWSTPKSQLKIYLGFELGLAAAALTLPWALAALSQIQAPAAVSETLFLAMALRWLAALGLITVPCLLMGATLPLLVSALGPESGLRARLGLIYGTNTLGAAIGAGFTGFYGLPEYGIRGSSYRAAAVSLVAAGLTLLVVLLAQRRARVDTISQQAPSSEKLGTELERRLALGTTFVSGFVLFSAEVIWARVLTFVFGHDSYAFAALLGFVLLGLSLGGLFYPCLRRQSPQRLLGWLMGGQAFALAGSFLFANRLVIEHGRDPFGLAEHAAWAGQLSVEVVRVLSFTPCLLFLPSLVAGVAYPVTIALHAGRDSHGGVSVGRVGLVNGLGGVLGALTTTLCWTGWFGIQWSLLLVSALALTMASGLFWFGSARKRPIAVALCGAFGLALFAYPRELPKQVLLEVVGPKHQTLLHYDEARTATVAVISNAINGERQLLVNAVNEVTTRLVHDQSFKLLGQLGPLLHPNPKRAVMICLGAGLAAGSALSHPLEQLDVVDLLTAVKDGARHFEAENNGVLYDPRFVLHRNDGRQYLLNSRRQFDLAIIDSTHPKSVDSWILYTTEFFRLVRERLTDDGIVVQWLPLHGLSEREFYAVVATFQRVFPDMMLWASVGYETYGQVGYAKLVGKKSGRIDIDLNQLQQRLTLPRVQADLVRYGMGEAMEVLDQFVAGPERIRAVTRNVPRLTDDRPFLAYLTELSQGRAMTPDRLIVLREPPWPWLNRKLLPTESAAFERAYEAQGMVVAGDLAHAASYYPEGQKLKLYLEQAKTSRAYYEAVAATYPKDVERLFEAGTQLATFGYLESAAAIFKQGLKQAPASLRLALNHSLIWLGRGRHEEAANELSVLVRAHPRHPLLHHNLGVALLSQGEFGAAKREFDRASSLDPTAFAARRRLAEMEARLGNTDRSQELLTALIREAPFDAELSFDLAKLYEQQGLLPRALAEFDRAWSLNPYHLPLVVHRARLVRDLPQLERLCQLYPTVVELRLLLADQQRELGRHEAACDHYVALLEQDPSLAAAAIGLGQSLRLLGRTAEAQDALCMAHRLKGPPAEIKRELRELGSTLSVCAAPH